MVQIPAEIPTTRDFINTLFRWFLIHFIFGDNFCIVFFFGRGMGWKGKVGREHTVCFEPQRIANRKEASVQPIFDIDNDLNEIRNTKKQK